jgi:hypothetical protein
MPNEEKSFSKLRIKFLESSSIFFLFLASMIVLLMTLRKSLCSNKLCATHLWAMEKCIALFILIVACELAAMTAGFENDLSVFGVFNCEFHS